MADCIDDIRGRNIDDSSSRIRELEQLLEEEIRRRQKAESTCEQLKYDLESTVKDKLDELEEAHAAQVSLNDNLLETALLVEKVHQGFASAIDDLGEGIRAKAHELTMEPGQTAGSQEQVQRRSSLLSELRKIQRELEDSKEQIGAAVEELKNSVKQQAKQSQASGDRYKSLFRRVKDGIFIVDRNWNVTDANPAMCEMLGYEYKRQMMGCNIHNDVFAEEYDFEMFEKDVIMSGYIRNYETKFMTHFGTAIYVTVSCTAIWGEGDVVLGYEGIVRDVTERKSLEEQRVRMLRLEAVNNMVITINHKVNQNLTTIYNYCQLLREDMKGGTVFADYVGAINSEVEKLIQLVSKISKIKQIRTTEYVDGVQMIDIESSIK